MEITKKKFEPPRTPSYSTSYYATVLYRSGKVELGLEISGNILTIRTGSLTDATGAILSVCAGNRRAASLACLEPDLRFICDEFLDGCDAMKEEA